MNWGTIRSLARTKIADPNALFWPDSDLLTYVNEGLSYITTNSEAHLKSVDFLLTASQRTYTLPDDYYELRSVRLNGIPVYGAKDNEMDELDLQYLTRTGTPQWYYFEGNKTLAFYPVSDGGSVLNTFTSELGEVVQWNDGTSNYTIDSELGIIHSIVDTSGGSGYFLTSEFGVVIEETSEDVVEIEYVYRSQNLSADSDVPDLPAYMHWALVYYVAGMAAGAAGKTQCLNLATRYLKRFGELTTEWFSRNKSYARGSNQMLSQQPVAWGSDLAWRQRIFP